jgi:dynein heavy chain
MSMPLRQGHVVLLQVQKMCLYSVHSNKSVRLEEWEQVQLAAMDTVGNHLKDVWAVSIKNIIK